MFKLYEKYLLGQEFQQIKRQNVYTIYVFGGHFLTG